MPEFSHSSFVIAQESPHRHSVIFYQKDNYPAWSVAQYLGEGLSAGESALVLATAEHTETILECLRAMDLPVRKFEASGTLQCVDAHDVLDSLGCLDSGGKRKHLRFEHNEAFTLLKQLLEKTLSRSATRSLRAMGELVSILVEREFPDQAVELEKIWNELLLIFPFQLYCAYEQSFFQRTPALDSFTALCDEHDIVIPYQPRNFSAGDPPGWLTLLQEQASILRREVLLRRRTERLVHLNEASRLSHLEACLENYRPDLSRDDLQQLIATIVDLTEQALMERTRSLPNSGEWHKRNGEILGYEKVISALDRWNRRLA